MLDDNQLQRMLIESIAASARLDARMNSIEQSINVLRADNEKALARISESLERLATIQEHLVSNADQHKVLHKRIDAITKKTEEIDDELHDMQGECKGCDYSNIMEQIAVIDKRLTEVNQSLKIIGIRLFGVPLWQIALGLILIGALIDILQHGAFIKEWIR